MMGTVMDAHGQPLGGARVVFTRRAKETNNSSSALPASVAAPIRALTDEEGIFSVEMAPFLAYTAAVEAPGIGKGETTVRPACGPCAMKFVLEKDGVKSVEHCNTSPL